MVLIKKIKKRDGRIVDFDQERITEAIWKAAQAVGGTDRHIAEQISNQVTAVLEVFFKSDDEIPTVEQIQDLVEKILIEGGHAKTAKAYIIYRQKRAEDRETKEAILGEGKAETSLNFSNNALQVLERRYLLRDEKGELIESPEELVRRIAKAIAKPDKEYGGNAKETEERFYEMIKELEFLPNSPTIMNAGTELGQLSACFVLPVEDSMEGIFDTLKHAALIHKSGGGTGFGFSRLRPSNDLVQSTKGVASGPVSFMKVFDQATEVIKQGGKRRGANMGIIRIDHPDVLDFVTMKADMETLQNFNISVAVTDKFMEALKKDSEYDLISPRDGKPLKKLKARMVFDVILANAWKNGDPGLIFIDEINRKSPVRHIGDIEATNPCITGDTLIYTDEGMITAKSLYLANKAINVLSDSRLSKDKKILKASNVFITGEKEVFKLMTKEGYNLKLTGDHKVMTEKGWIEAQDLKPGDKIYLLNRKGCFGTKGSLKLGQILGWYVGDGTLKSDRVTLSFFGEEKQELAPLFAEMVNEEMDGLQKLNRKYEVNVVDIASRDEARVSSSRLKRVAHEYGLNPSKFDLSEKLFTTSEKFQKGFLQGLFTADGTVIGNLQKGVSVRLAQSNLFVLEMVQQMLLNLGIASKIYKNRRKAQEKMLPDGKGGYKSYECKAQHELVISKENIQRFKEEINFLTKKKSEKLNAILPKMKRKPYREKFLVTFKELISEGIEVVYDLTEPLTHSFIANGLVVHNCGEQPLLGYESCNLGSINLNKFVNEDKTDLEWDRLRETVHLCTHFLDNVIDANHYPIEQIAEMTRSTRKIGLGVMGFADMLYQLGVKYDSEEGILWGEKVMKFINDEAIEKSKMLAEERGVFPVYKGSMHDKNGVKMRNSCVTTVAPTGTIGMLAEASGGLEPNFAISFIKNVMDGTELIYTNKYFKEVAKERGFYSKELMRKIAKTGTIQGFDEIPDDIKEIFVTAQDITPERHIRMQAAFQKHVDSSVSKTINFPKSATIGDIEEAYMLAYDIKCKGVTIYRDQSRESQVLNIGVVNTKKEKKVAPKKTVTKEEIVRIEESHSAIKPKAEEVVLPSFADEISNTNDIGINDTFESKAEEFKLPPINPKQISKETNHATLVAPPKIVTKQELLESKMCPECKTSLQISEGCMMCPGCGFSACTV